MQVVVTGANRGLGLAFTRAYLARGATVYATCRDPDAAVALAELAAASAGRLRLLQLELPEPASIAAFHSALAAYTDRIDRLINNAGILVSGERFGVLDADAMARTHAVNVIGPVLLSQACADLLERGERPRIVNVSSALGSIGSVGAFTSPSYNASKAALNMWTRLLAQALNPRGVLCFAISPGWVRTAMGGENAELSPEQSVADVIGTIEAAGEAEQATLLRRDGVPLPW